MTDFRTALGTLHPNVPGEVGEKGGRREVNWAAVPPGFTNTVTFPGDFFNQNFSADPMHGLANYAQNKTSAGLREGGDNSRNTTLAGQGLEYKSNKD